MTLICCLPLSGQHNHSGDHAEENDKSLFKYSPQHGGEIVEAGKYKFEVLINPMQLEEKLTIYVLKKNHKELFSKEIVGKATLKYKDGTVDSVDLAFVNYKLVCSPKDLTQPVNIFLLISINNKEYNAVYYYKGLSK